MFDEKFFEAIGLHDASPDKKAELADQLGEAVQNRVAVRLSNVLTQEQMEKFSELADGSEEKAFDYLQEQYPDYPLIVAEEVESVKAELSHDVASVRDALKK